MSAARRRVAAAGWRPAAPAAAAAAQRAGRVGRGAGGAVVPARGRVGAGRSVADRVGRPVGAWRRVRSAPAAVAVAAAAAWPCAAGRAVPGLGAARPRSRAGCGWPAWGPLRLYRLARYTHLDLARPARDLVGRHPPHAGRARRPRRRLLRRRAVLSRRPMRRWRGPIAAARPRRLHADLARCADRGRQRHSAMRAVLPARRAAGAVSAAADSRRAPTGNEELLRGEGFSEADLQGAVLHDQRQLSARWTSGSAVGVAAGRCPAPGTFTPMTTTAANRSGSPPARIAPSATTGPTRSVPSCAASRATEARRQGRRVVAGRSGWRRRPGRRSGGPGGGPALTRLAPRGDHEIRPARASARAGFSFATPAALAGPRVAPC